MKTTEQIEHDKNLRRVVVSSLVGAVIEWYDFFLYGVVAGLIFNHLYFPEFDDRIGDHAGVRHLRRSALWPVLWAASCLAISAIKSAAKRCWCLPL